MIRTAQMGTFRRDFHDPRLCVSGDRLTQTVVGPLSVRMDKIQHYIGWTRLDQDSEDAARRLLLLYEQLEIDWDASFDGKMPSSADQCFHFDLPTGEFAGLAAYDDQICRLDAVVMV